MQASLAIVAGVAGGAVAWLQSSAVWATGTVLIFSVVPFTFIAIMSTNRQLLDARRDRASPETADLLQRWGRLHAVRSVLSAVATCLFIYALITP